MNAFGFSPRQLILLKRGTSVFALINADLSRLVFRALYVLVILFAFTVSLALSCARRAYADSSSPGFAVLELFTSQGCSSCPPADALLSRIAKDATLKSLRVYPLSFHVDYWNNLGWKDPYSSGTATERQYQYAGKFGASRVYTPQLVVNGEIELSGTDEPGAYKAITQALKGSAPLQIELKAQRGSGRLVTVHWSLRDQVSGAVLQIALVADNKGNSVPRGENAGNTLSHSNVVLGLRTVDLARGREGSIELTMEDNIKPEELSVIGFIQQKADLKILGALKTGLLRQ